MSDYSFNKSRLEWCAPPGSPEENTPSRKLEVVVVFTSEDATIAAIHRAAALATGLNGHISLVELQSVPRQLPLENPLVSLDFSKRRLLKVANTCPLESTAYLYLCRCPFDTLTSIVKSKTLIVIGRRSRWWPTWEMKLSRRLVRAGYQVIVHKSR